MDIWISIEKETPDQWGRYYSKEWVESRYRVRLADGREIHSWWEDGKWSVEVLMPQLKVVSWLMPVIIA